MDILEQDFDFILSTLRRVHPAYTQDSHRLDSAASFLKQRYLGKEEARITFGRLTALPGDGHTNLEIPYHANTLCLPLAVRWIKGELTVMRDYEFLRQGDRLQAICGISINDYLGQLSRWLSHENQYLLLGRTTCYPQENHHLFSALNLQAVFGFCQQYELEAKRDEKQISGALAPAPFSAVADSFDNPGFTDGKSIRTYYGHNGAAFCLDANRDSPEFRDELDRFFRTVTRQGIHRILLDLGRNLGGTDAVINTFLGYLAIDTYRGYGMKRRAEGGGIAFIRPRGEQIRLNHPADTPLYTGQLLCAVSPLTFSSARTMAVTLRDNNLATIVGEPTGGRPTSYGLPRRFTTPGLHIPFRVSTCEFQRPNAAQDDENSLIPDILCPESPADAANFSDENRNHRLDQLLSL